VDRQVRQGLSPAVVSTALAAVVLCAACEGPPWPAEAQSPQPAAVAADAPKILDAGMAPARPFHTLTLAQCARAAQDCLRAHGGDSAGPAYLVAFGSGVGSLRTREQAMADLYRELRDRTASGGHLAARPRHLDEPEGGALPPPDETEVRRGPPMEKDPLVEAAFELMAVVDREGEVTVDTAPSSDPCKVALGAPELPDASASTARCFLKEDTFRYRHGR
jgi:hypothetical protein